MQKRISYILAIGLITLMGATASMGAEADTKKIGAEADAKKPSAKAPAKEKKSTGRAFHGKLSAIDKANMTVTVEEKGKPRIIHITSHTRISKAGKPATLSDAVIGDEIGGQAKKNAAGEEQAATVRLGAAKTSAKPSAKKEKKPDAKKKE